MRTTTRRQPGEFGGRIDVADVADVANVRRRAGEWEWVEREESRGHPP